MDKKLFRSILLIITYAVVLVIVLLRLDLIGQALVWLLQLLRPLIIGFAIAFVLNRPCHFFHRLYGRALSRTPAQGAARGLAVLTSYLVLIAVIVAIFSFVLPKLAESVQIFASNLNGYIANIQSWINQLIAYFHLDTQALDLSNLNDVLKNLLNNVLGFLADLGPHLLEFLVILQQIEGNVIYPKVVGSSIGLPGIWVLAAVTVGGSVLGLVGVVLSVPVASVLYTLLRMDVHRRLDT